MVAEKTSLSKKDVNEVISASFETIMDAVTDGKKVTFLGFGSFEPRDRKARTGRNPKTGEVCVCHSVNWRTRVELTLLAVF